MFQYPSAESIALGEGHCIGVSVCGLLPWGYRNRCNLEVEVMQAQRWCPCGGFLVLLQISAFQAYSQQQRCNAAIQADDMFKKGYEYGAGGSLLGNLCLVYYTWHTEYDGNKTCRAGIMIHIRHIGAHQKSGNRQGMLFLVRSLGHDAL